MAEQALKPMRGASGAICPGVDAALHPPVPAGGQGTHRGDPSGRTRPDSYPGRVARSRNLRIWVLVFWGVCFLAALGAHSDASEFQARDGGRSPAMGVASADPNAAAVLPPSVARELRSVVESPPLRVLVLAVLVTLVGLPPVLRRASATASGRQRPLQARRYIIALRAPPLQFA